MISMHNTYLIYTLQLITLINFKWFIQQMFDYFIENKILFIWKRIQIINIQILFSKVGKTISISFNNNELFILYIGNETASVKTIRLSKCIIVNRMRLKRQNEKKIGYKFHVEQLF